MQLRTIIVALTLWALSPLPGFSQQSVTESATSGARPEVLVLGVWHMANPGSHVVNVEADDVLAPKRQAEIAEVMAVLKKFSPRSLDTRRCILWMPMASSHSREYRFTPRRGGT
jgi:hypothetical protein